MTRAERVIAFIERFCVVPEGAKVGQPLKLAAFQKRFIREIYDNPAGTRRAYLAIARKNGKTGLIASILLAHLVGPEARQNSQIVSGARSRDQASLVFSLAAKMVRLNPELASLVRIVDSGKRLIGLARNVEYKALAADGTKLADWDRSHGDAGDGLFGAVSLCAAPILPIICFGRLGRQPGNGQLVFPSRRHRSAGVSGRADAH